MAHLWWSLLASGPVLLVRWLIHVSADQMSHECWSVTHVYMYMYQSDGVLMLAR